MDIPGFGTVNFASVEGIGMTHRTQRVLPGGKFATQELYLGTDYTDVTLKNGVSRSTQLWDWANHAIAMYDEYSKSALFNAGFPLNGQYATLEHGFLTDITITQLSNTGLPVKKWVLTDAWVKAYNLGTLDASQSQVSFESVTLSYSGLKVDDVVASDLLGSDVPNLKDFIPS